MKKVTVYGKSLEEIDECVEFFNKLGYVLCGKYYSHWQFPNNTTYWQDMIIPEFPMLDW